MAKWRIAGINFDHMHMGDLLRMAHEHPDAEIVGIYDKSPEKMAQAISDFAIAPSAVFTDLDTCVEQTKPDLAILCAATAEHADHVEALAKHRVHIHIEKPFAASVAEARRMIRAMEGTGRLMAINWPLAWYPSHNTCKRLIDDGVIGDLIEVHFYDGNRGPLFHLADKVEVTPEEVERQKPDSWWYKKASGGGSLLDYLGYGATLGTWFMNGEAPLEVTSVVDETPGIEVDQHSITVCRYRRGLSKMETRWGTFTDPWTTQPQPKCGFVVVGTDGTISSYDYDDYVTVQTRDNPEQTPVPVDALAVGKTNPIEYLLGCIERNEAVTGPLSPDLSLTAQRIVDTAALSAQQKKTLELVS
ncbi:Gfo/Idh/MocA family protein [Hoeflea prorocentri]|uniref:Gfo/Idh/MocA family oxidoreductase n=1 Tax=Hoeflea prorocentri TaxID=1922333 RepID=A0A9X3ZI96_9HYPH|nr:Gfo/Idh/MocA family oxidoreductase [Hoeflea prorocentri]MCY6381778.1 Gfo/Idh/MocA family oxidoreductase [Hoeflea prorocentri]MDA5399578.1 Gfo/Idh/MocA family oxidoreductase [Hoeflea prorocentri]